MNAVEMEIDAEESYDEMLDDCYGQFMGYWASDILKEVDPIAYRVGLSDYESEQEESWSCSRCWDVYDTQEEAEHCCMYECDECGEWYEHEDDAISCCEEDEEEEEEDDED